MKKDLKKPLILGLAALCVLSATATVPTYAAMKSSDRYPITLPVQPNPTLSYTTTKTYENEEAAPEKIYYELRQYNGYKYEGYLYKRSVSLTSDGQAEVTYSGVLCIPSLVEVI